MRAFKNFFILYIYKISVHVEHCLVVQISAKSFILKLLFLVQALTKNKSGNLIIEIDLEFESPITIYGTKSLKFSL